VDVYYFLADWLAIIDHDQLQFVLFHFSFSSVFKKINLFENIRSKEGLRIRMRKRKRTRKNLTKNSNSEGGKIWRYIKLE